ncbi:ribulose-phosphate 3-epimerase [candidate division GN15 bacterium]|uniref:Ribulose-phosphate 3-epimerase n=1 Tax=candidate division GN15 bacterium TaxID=2072418 RepID=A0A855X321_9BACT|nr:MAG: ribulose-phosphate 3-epimerase [candidate division GN15 bacterium]
MVQIAPSVLGADFGRLADEIKSADQAGIRMYHLDIMDGHFVPNISFGPGIVKTINQLTHGFLDVHLMLSEPEKYFEPFVKAGADSITFHLEVHPDPVPYAEQLRQLRVQTGISINPDMPVERVLPFLKHFDLLLVMSVFPGFGGQKFIESALGAIRAARSYVDSHNLKTQIQVDGGVDGSNAAEVVAAGADILVMGTGFFGRDDRAQLVQQVSQLKSARERSI